MKITLRVQYFGTDDKQDSISVASDLLAAFAMNPKADGITLSVQPTHFAPSRGSYGPIEEDTYHNSKVKYRD